MLHAIESSKPDPPKDFVSQPATLLGRTVFTRHDSLVLYRPPGEIRHRVLQCPKRQQLGISALAISTAAYLDYRGQAVVQLDSTRDPVRQCILHAWAFSGDNLKRAQRTTDLRKRHAGRPRRCPAAPCAHPPSCPVHT